MRKARIENNRVVEILDADPFPPFHPDLVWAECGASVQAGWSYDGSVFSAPFDTDPARLAQAKLNKTGEAKGEALRRIQLQVPEWDTYDKVYFLASIWSMLGSPTAAQTSAKDIYVYARSTVIPNVIAQTSVSAVQAVDVQNDPGWPA